MNILILGAGSQIGRELALRFSSGNIIALSGRNQQTLAALASECLAHGAVAATTHINDLSAGAKPLIDEFGSADFDLIINLVAATSRVRDSELDPAQVHSYVSSDFLTPVQFVGHMLGKSNRPLRLIFVSSVLAAIRSPDRMLYGSLKLLQELTLRKLMARRKNQSDLLVVQVGKVIQYERPSPQARSLASAIYDAYGLGKMTLRHGLAGHMYVFTYHLQPVLFSLLLRAQRLLRTEGRLKRR